MGVVRVLRPAVDVVVRAELARQDCLPAREIHCISAEDSAEAVNFLPHMQMEQMCCAGARQHREAAA